MSLENSKQSEVENEAVEEKSSQNDSKGPELSYAFPEFDLGVVPLFNLWALPE